MIYRGPCEELWGKEIPDPPKHNCSESLTHETSDCVETHGLDCGPYERWTERWWRCTVCGELYDTPEEAEDHQQPPDFEQRTLAAVDRAHESAILRELENEARPDVAE